MGNPGSIRTRISAARIRWLWGRLPPLRKRVAAAPEEEFPWRARKNDLIHATGEPNTRVGENEKIFGGLFTINFLTGFILKKIRFATIRTMPDAQNASSGFALCTYRDPNA